MRGVEHPLPSIGDVIERTIVEGRLTNPADRLRRHRHQHRASEREGRAGRSLERTGKEYGLPCVDPIRTGCGPIVDLLQKRYHA